MKGFSLHPALRRILVLQSMGKVRKISRRMTSRARVVTTSFALLLSLVWIINAAFSISLREPYPPHKFHNYVSLFLLAYCLWHVVRVAWKRPEAAIEWTPAERDLLCGGPFSRGELLSYRLTVILTSTTVKALLASLFLLPDLGMWWTGFLGFMLGLTFLEYFRVIVETAVCSLSTRNYNLARATLFGLIIAAVWWSSTAVVPAIGAESHLASARDLSGAFAGWIDRIDLCRQTVVGRILEFPFLVFTDVITLHGFRHGEWIILTTSFILVGAAAQIAVYIDGYFEQLQIRREQEHYNPDSIAAPAAEQMAETPLAKIPFGKGAGPLAWRQWMGVRQHFGSVLASLVVPGILSCLSLTLRSNAHMAFLTVLASVVFYSFVLLPAALKFDFRRDFERLSMLKMLPFSARSIACGQLVVPVLITSLFQLTVLSVAIMFRPVPLHLLWSAMLMLVPMNIFFCTLDNLIFLLSPHRANQEGIEVFLRSTLTFTGKALLLGLLLVLVAGWAMISPGLSLSLHINPASAFFLGLGLLWAFLASIVFALLTNAFRRFDPSIDPVG